MTVPEVAQTLPWNAYVSEGADNDPDHSTFDRCDVHRLGAVNTAGMVAQLYVVKAGAEDVAFDMSPSSFSADSN